jgi:hypothetical protein
VGFGWRTYAPASKCAHGRTVLCFAYIPVATSGAIDTTFGRADTPSISSIVHLVRLEMETMALRLAGG